MIEKGTPLSLPDELAALLPDGTWRQQLRERVLAWYDQHRRDLPWRASRDPYRVWISETMLQQTTVAAVVPYFERFLAALPTVADLAAAQEQQVLRLWEGLGYYRRARHLHAAAKQIVHEHQGNFPQDVEPLRALPGIGRYTAGAILSIAFDKREPIVEANTLRLYSRLLGYTGDPRSSAGQKLLWHAAGQWLPAKRVGDFNQALMEIGGQVCLVSQPDCDTCPLSDLCQAYQQNLQEAIPVPAAKRQIEQVCDASVVVYRQNNGQDEVLLQLNGPKAARWAGLWDFIRFRLEEPPSRKFSAAVTKRLAQAVLARTGLTIEATEHLAVIKHGVTRFRITLECYAASVLGQRTEVESTGLESEAAEFRWVSPADLENYPLSVTGRKLARIVNRRDPDNAAQRTLFP